MEKISLFNVERITCLLSRKIIACILILFCLSFNIISAQYFMDKIETKQGETIICKITKVDSANIYFDVDFNNKITKTRLSVYEVLDYNFGSKQYFVDEIETKQGEIIICKITKIDSVNLFFDVEFNNNITKTWLSKNEVLSYQYGLKQNTIDSLSLLNQKSSNKIRKLKTNDNIISFSLTAPYVVYSFNISNEFFITNYTSFCMQYSHYNQMGYKLSTGIRYYFSKTNPIYIDCRFLHGSFTSNFTYFHPYSNDGGEPDQRPVSVKQSFGTNGFSVLLGTQYVFFNHLTIDINLGIQILPLNISSTTKVDGQIVTRDDLVSNLGEQFAWYAYGPGSIFNGNICIGFKF